MKYAKKFFSTSQNKTVHQHTNYLEFLKNRDFYSHHKDTKDFSHLYPKSGNYFAKRYIREVLAILFNPQLLENSKISEEAKIKANEYFKFKGFNIGAYSDSRGVLELRKNLINHMFLRDGFSPSEDDLYYTNGGTNAYDHAVKLIFNKGEKILVPNPCPPIYLNINSSLGIKNVEYKLSFENDSKSIIDKFGLMKIFESSETFKAMYVINPNQPLGHIINRKDMEFIIKFCYDKGMVLIANEELQNCIYTTETPFLSFRKVVQEMPAPYNELELFSINSASKHEFLLGAFRGGYLDTLNIDPEVTKQLYKYKSIDLCSNLPGQIMMDLALCPPKKENYSQKFIDNYFNSIDEHKKDKLIFLEKFRHALINSGISAPKIDSGYSFFCKVDHKFYTVDNKFVSNYCSELLKELNIKFTPGTEFGKGNLDYINIFANFNTFDFDEFNSDLKKFNKKYF